MGGIIMGALAGAGGQMVDLADKSITQGYALDRDKASNDLAMQRDRASADLATQRAEALELFKEGRGNVMRDQRNARIDAAAGAIADQKASPELQSKFTEERAGIVDRASWTPEQQAAMEQSKRLDQTDRAGIIDKAKSDGTAAVASGDIEPKDAMNNTSKLEINQIKMQSLLDRANDRNATMEQIANVRAESLKYGYELRLQAAQEKRLSGKIDTATGRMLITSEDANIKASTNQMLMLQRELENTSKVVGGKPNPRLAEIQQQVQGLRDDIEESKARKTEFLDSMGIAGAKPKPKADAPDPAPGAAPAATPAVPAASSALPAGVPAGSKQIGTSGGKPVFQSPDGKKWKVQ